MSIQQKSIAKLSPAQLNWLSLTMKLGSNQLPPPTHLRKFTVNPFDRQSIQSQLAKKFYKLQLFLIFSFTYITLILDYDYTNYWVQVFLPPPRHTEMG